MNRRSPRSGTLRRTCSGLLATLFLLAGCARPETGPPVIKLATWFGTDEARQMQTIIDRINRRHHDFQVQLVTVPGGDYLTKIDTMMAGRLAPDLFLLSQEYVPSYSSIGAIEDLDSRIRHDPAIDLPDYYPAALQTASWRGHLYGLPITMMPVVLYYNKKLFDAAHEPYPTRDWDWARFREAAMHLTKRNADGRYTQWGFLQAQWPPLPIWIWQNGGDVLSADGTRPTYTDPATVQALQFVQNLVVRDHVSPTDSTVQQMGLDELFKSGRVAMFFGGASDDKDRVPGLPVGVCELPHGKTRATFCWMAHLVISPQTKHEKKAYVAWRELLDGFQHWKIVPPRRSLAKRLAALEPRKAAAAGAILASMEYAHGLRGVVDETDWNDFVYEKLTEPLLDGEATASAAAAETDAKLTRVLEETP